MATIFDEVIVENVLNLRKETDIHVQEVQRAPCKINDTILKHISIKIALVKIRKF